MSGIDKTVKLMLHGDGVDNGIVFTDSSQYVKSVNRSGNVVTKTGTYKFGTSSLYFDGVGDYLSVADHADWNFAQEDFCIDLWVNFSSLPATNAIAGLMSQYSSASVYWRLAYIDVSGTKSLVFQNNGINICDYNIIFNIGQWYHIAISRYYEEGIRTTRLFIDGAIVNSVTTDYTVADTLPVLNIGSGAGASNYFTGYLDEIRVCKYDPKYISTFTPEIDAYSLSQTFWHINPSTGNDNLSGTSWSSAWRSMKYGAVATAIAPGDTVKIAKSPDPASIGNATWTNTSATVILESVLTQDIDLCNTGWIATPNITLTHDINYRKQGTAGLKLAVGSLFTIGKLAYKTLSSSLDLSAYTAISFWCQANLASSYGLKICLCSDTIGDVIVDTFYVQPIDMVVSSYWTPRRINKGSSLGNSIQSIAIYIDVDPITPTIYFDNIMACNDFSLYSLITKKDSNNEYEAWYSIQSIVGTTILLDWDSLSNYTASMGYYGTSGTNVTTYRREPIYISNTDDYTPMKSGSPENLIWYSGGWDTILDELTGQTYIDGCGVTSNGIINSGFDYNKFSFLNIVRAYSGINISGNYNQVDIECIANCFTNGFYVSGTNNTGTIKYINNIGKAYNCVSLSGNSNTFTILNIINSGCGVTSNSGFGNKLTFSIIANMSSTLYSGMIIRGAECKFYGGEIKDCIGPGIVFYDSVGTNYFYDIVFTANSIDVQCNSFGFGIQQFVNCTFNSNTILTAFGIGYLSECRLIKIAGNVNDNRVYKRGGNIISQTAIRHTNSGIAWAMSPTSKTLIIASLPLVCPLSKIAIVANSMVTVTAWFRRTNTEIIASLVCPENHICGITTDIIDSMTANADIWEQLSIQFTPTETGVVEIQAQVYGGDTHSVYIDDISIS